MQIKASQNSVDNTSGAFTTVETLYDCKVIPLTVTSEDTKNPDVSYSDTKVLVTTDREIELTDKFVDTFSKEFSIVKSQKMWSNPKIFSVIMRSDRG